MNRKRILTLLLTLCVLVTLCLSVTLTVTATEVTPAETGEVDTTTDMSADTEEDLGGAFSLERLKLAGIMLLVGMGMVFLVLAILWAVLIIFKKVMYDGAGKKKEKAEKPTAPTVPAADTPDDAMIAAVAGVVAYQADDGAIAAAITAAIAETIASDPALSREFAGGFRVVSFERKSGKRAWNQ